MAEDYEDVQNAPPKEPEQEKSTLPPEDTLTKFKAEAEAYFNRYYTDRSEIDEENKIADYMYACAQNRTIMSSERTKGANVAGDTRANVGSPLFFRMVNTMASLYAKVMRTRKVPFEYTTIGSTEVTGSTEDGLNRAAQANALALWSLKEDGWPAKLAEHATHAFKYSNTFCAFYWKRTFKRYLVVEPEYAQVQREDGTVEYQVVGEKKYYVNDVAENRPCISFPHVDCVYMDRWIPDVQSQNCIILLRLRNRSEIWGDVVSGLFDEKSYELLSEQDHWNGQYGAELKKLEADNRELDFNPNQSKMFLEWTVLIRAPVAEDTLKWDEKAPPLIYWVTVIGNTLQGGKVMQFVRNPDPDDEFPVVAIRAYADKSDTLYHTTTASVTRSAYSADCTLLNMAIDNMANVNDPPMTVIDGRHRIRDFTLRKGQRWSVDSHDAIKVFEMRDNTLQTANLRKQVQDDAKQALSMDGSSMGEYAGARTSASEALMVGQGVKDPQLLQIGYMVNQLCPFLAKKIKSYWKAYGLPDQVIQITNEGKQYDIKPVEVFGDFDIVVNIVDEFEDNNTKQQQASSILQTIGNVPYFQQSAHHTTDPGEILKVWLKTMGWESDRIVLPATGQDSEAVANMEVSSMLNGGVYVTPMPGQNTPIHLRVERAERMRWRGLEDIDDPRAKNLHLLDQHIAEEENMIKAGGAVNPGTLPALPPEQTPGQQNGSDIAAMMGATAGGTPPIASEPTP